MGYISAEESELDRLLWQKYVLWGDLNEDRVDLVHKMGAVVLGLNKKGSMN